MTDYVTDVRYEQLVRVYLGKSFKHGLPALVSAFDKRENGPLGKRPLGQRSVSGIQIARNQSAFPLGLDKKRLAVGRMSAFTCGYIIFSSRYTSPSP